MMTSWNDWREHWSREVAEERVQRLMKRLDEFIVEEHQLQPKTYEQLITPADALLMHALGVRLD